MEYPTIYALVKLSIYEITNISKKEIKGVHDLTSLPYMWGVKSFDQFTIVINEKLAIYEFQLQRSDVRSKKTVKDIADLVKLKASQVGL